MRLRAAPLPRGEFLRDVPLLDEFVHSVGRTALSGAVVLEQTRVLFIQRLLPPGNQMKIKRDSLRKYMPETQIHKPHVFTCTSAILSP